MNNERASQSLLKGIKYFIDKKINDYPIDKTFTGLIKNIKEDNLYDILIQGKIYTNIPSFFSGLEINDIVKINAPQGQYSQMYIEGKYNMFDLKNINKINNKILELENKDNEIILKMASLEKEINELKGETT